MSEPSELVPKKPSPFRNSSRAEALGYFASAVSVLTLLLFLTSRSGVSTGAVSPTEEADSVTAADPIRLDALSLDEISSASATVAERASRSVVRVEVAFHRTPNSDDLEIYFGTLPQEQIASGVVVDASGFVVTNYHVIRGAEHVSVASVDGALHHATVVGYDALTDLAVLRVPDLGLPALSWGDSDQTAAGNLVWAIGNPYGLDQSVSMGVISSTDRPTMLDSPFQDFLQTDASINPGNSGGALVDARGRLIGINTAIAGDSFRGISFALPGNTARQVYEQLRAGGSVPRGWIGVQLGAVTQARAALADLKQPAGAYVESLSPVAGAPAQAAGLQVGDICIRFEQQTVSGPLGLIRQIANHPTGTTARLTILRNRHQIEVEIQVKQRP